MRKAVKVVNRLMHTAAQMQIQCTRGIGVSERSELTPCNIKQINKIFHLGCDYPYEKQKNRQNPTQYVLVLRMTLTIYFCNSPLYIDNYSY
jgi:hypothetical protein